MKLRYYSALCAAIATIGLSSSTAFAKDNLMLGYADPETSIFGKAAIAFSEKLTELSNGQMTVNMFPNATLGTIQEMPAMLQQGTCDVTLIVTSSLTDLVADLGVFDMPFLFDSYDSARAKINGEAGKFMAEKLEEQNMHLGSWLTMGFREVTSKKPINSLKDFEGLKIRVRPIEVHQEIFKSLKAAPTVINFSELYAAMEQGTVDAQENPYVNIYNNTYYEVQKYLTETNHVFQVAALVMSKSTYDEFTDEQKKWVDEAAAYAADVEWKATVEDNEIAKKGCIGKGMIFTKLDHAALLESTKGVYDKYKDRYGKLVDLLK